MGSCRTARGGTRSLLSPPPHCVRCARAADDPWAAVPAPVETHPAANVPRPRFRDHPLRRRSPTARLDCSDAFRRAIDAAAKRRRRTRRRPRRHLADRRDPPEEQRQPARRQGRHHPLQSRPEAYPIVLTRFEGMECMNYSPFVYAFEQQNIAITGGGTLDGQASCEHWWPGAARRSAAPRPATSAKRARP